MRWNGMVCVILGGIGGTSLFESADGYPWIYGVVENNGIMKVEMDLSLSVLSGVEVWSRSLGK